MLWVLYSRYYIVEVCGDEFECKYPAFTGISREIRCDLGEGDKARRGGVGGSGSIFIILSFSQDSQNREEL